MATPVELFSPQRHRENLKDSERPATKHFLPFPLELKSDFFLVKRHTGL